MSAAAISITGTAGSEIIPDPPLTVSPTPTGLRGDNVLVASGFGCKLDSDRLTGGGTDDTIALQSAFDALEANGGGELVVGRPALISDVLVSSSHPAALLQPPKTRLRFLPGAAFYLKNGSNCVMLSNKNITGNPAATFDEDIEIVGGILNGNEANQNKFERGVNTNAWVQGVWFSGFRNLRIIGTEIRNAKTFAFTLGNGDGFMLQDCRAYWTSGLTGSSNKDSLHLHGTLIRGLARNFWGNGDDDTVGFNTDEGVLTHATSNCFAKDRFSWSGGDITDITIDGMFAAGSSGQHTYRFIGYGNGTSNCDNIIIRGVRGGSGMTSSFTVPGEDTPGVTLGRLTIDGWFVASSPIKATASHLCLSNILPGTDTSLASGSDSQYGDWFARPENLPTEDPHAEGAEWNNSGIRTISAG